MCFGSPKPPPPPPPPAPAPSPPPPIMNYDLPAPKAVGKQRLAIKESENRKNRRALRISLGSLNTQGSQSGLSLM